MLRKYLIGLVMPLLAFITTVHAQWDSNMAPGRTTMVHLFEWRWNDIAAECERFLGPYGYGGVQVSPPNENRIYKEGHEIRPWFERYQPVSYKLQTRSGSEEEFKSMVQRCNAVGVRIYVDAVINHMTGGGSGQGTGGSYYDNGRLQYDGVPYSSLDFNGKNNCPTSSGNIESYQDVSQVRNCRLVSLSDLATGNEYVRGKIVDYLNRLISYGVAGFRIDASKHMWPGDLQAIFGRLNSLPSNHGFAQGSRPFLVQEVIDPGTEPIKAEEYLHLGRVTEFMYSAELGAVFKKVNGQRLSYLKNWGEGWGLIPSTSALAFMDNHDNQRGHGMGGANILTFKDSENYKVGVAFALAWPYGLYRVMSSYNFNEHYQGPPHDGNYNILEVTVNPDQTCGNGWVCEHRWRQIRNMVNFRNVANNEPVLSWYDNGNNQIAFSRGNKAFIAINHRDGFFNRVINTSLPGGRYCDIFSGDFVNGSCTGRVVDVKSNGDIHISMNDGDSVLAIHVEAKL